MPQSPSNPNIFSDEYAMPSTESFGDSMEARSEHSVDDSPVSPISNADENVFGRSESFQSSASSQQRSREDESSNGTDSTISASENRIGDSAQGHRHQGSVLGSSANPTHVPGHRSASSASSFAGSQSPISPGNGPSHPYFMYPQGLPVSRSTSVATASTNRPSSQVPHIRTPAHPYALYTQNVGVDAPTSVPSNSIPVGFPGNHGQYHRRIGAEGEEQDLIGPDGHTEQLPPYTQFPEESNQKALVGTGLPSIGESTPVESPDHEQQAQENQTVERNSQYARYDSPGGQHMLGSTSQYQKEEGEIHEKPWKDKTWKDKKRTKICGVIPLWLLLLLVAGMVVVIVVVCGGVIGGVLGHHASNADASQSGGSPASIPVVSTTTETQLLDASAVTSTPAGLPPVPTGTFDSKISGPLKQYSGCVTDKRKGKAWSCSLTSDTLRLVVDKKSSQPQMALKPNTQYIQMGTQPPLIPMRSMSLVYDFAQQELGPAFQFQVLFNKTVVLPEAMFGNDNGDGKSSPKWKRNIPPSFTGHEKHQPVARSVDHTDTPWFCHWPETFFEAFLYVNESVASPAPSYSTSTTSSSKTPVVTPSTGSGNPIDLQQKGKLGQHELPSIPEHHYGNHENSGGHQDNGGNEDGDAEDSDNGDSDDDGDSDEDDPPHKMMKLFRRHHDTEKKGYPKKLKLEERRLHKADPGSAYCQKMQWDGTKDDWIPRLDENGNTTWFPLDEEDPNSPDVFSMKRRSTDDSRALRPRAAPDSACYCQWNNWE